MELNPSIRLRTLEIQASESVTSGWDSSAIYDFLDAFTGLEELFICEPGPQSSIDLWKHATRHGATLKKLVYHQRITDIEDETPYFGEEFDIEDLGILDREMRDLKENPSQNPLAALDLEVIGLVLSARATGKCHNPSY